MSHHEQTPYMGVSFRRTSGFDLGPDILCLVHFRLSGTGHWSPGSGAGSVTNGGVGDHGSSEFVLDWMYGYYFFVRKYEEEIGRYGTIS